MRGIEREVPEAQPCTFQNERRDGQCQLLPRLANETDTEPLDLSPCWKQQKQSTI